MGQARGLIPYAAFAVFIVGATIVALVATVLAGPPAAAPAAAASPAADATAAARPTTDLSPTGRIAYWRSEANGDYLLWVANADNSRRRSVAKTDQPNAVARTRWSFDGGSVAYVESGVRLVAVRVDGVATSYTLAPEVRAGGYRIVDHRFSPSGARIAATVQRTNGAQTDVYVSGPGGTWNRLTTSEDVLAADWISEDELLVQTVGGIIGRLRVAGRDQLRPITALRGMGPVIGDDGRIHFLAPFTGPNDAVFGSSPIVYSINVDGEDLRTDNVTVPSDSAWLDGIWPGGAYLVHRGISTAQALFGTAGEQVIPTSAGIIERLQVSPDRRFAIGFTGSNLVRLDLAQGGAIANVVVLLGSIGPGDAWFARTRTLARSTRPNVDVPAARYAFALGGYVWVMGSDGEPTVLRSASANGQIRRGFTSLPAPRWSPGGDRLLTLESLSPGSPSFQLIAVAIARDGTVRRYTSPSSVGTTLSWSPDGSQFAATTFTTPATDPSVLQSDLAISLVDVSSGTVARTLPGREAYWTRAGIVVLSNGTYRGGSAARDDQALELVANNNEKRVIVALGSLVADPRMQAPSVTRGVTQASGLTASTDGAYAAIHVSFLSGNSGRAGFAIVRSRDGTPTVVVARDGVADEAWSPNGRLVGYTLITAQGSGTRRSAVVRDAETGDIVQETDGRFAGWSPDGSWTYVARNEGLYARRLAGGDPVRFSPYGVVVAVTRP
ncbi:MAG TPA: hypothetical protein VFV20_09150 [Candidatus Limnocylindria bacterium]|nr:hypothetical protein [Candidatus Limnocylindria bacterium]